MNHQPNKIIYKVISQLEPITLKKRIDAKELKRSLKKANIDSDIIRVETTDEGFIVDERKI